MTRGYYAHHVNSVGTAHVLSSRGYAARFVSRWRRPVPAPRPAERNRNEPRHRNHLPKRWSVPHRAGCHVYAPVDMRDLTDKFP